jgi:hypothetical protein
MSTALRKNIVIQVASGLTAGIHTVRIRKNHANPLLVNGYEVINNTANITVNPGTYSYKGTQRTSISTSLSYNSGFETVTGTDTGTGGVVSIYQKSNGVIAHAVRYNASAPTYFTGSVDHSNEVVAEEKFYREFGAAANSGLNLTDFSSDISGLDRHYIGDDGGSILFGATTIPSRSIASTQFLKNTSDGITISINSNPLTYGFIGTGLDIEFCSAITAGNVYNIKIDGSLIANIPNNSLPFHVFKVASGLKYGYHTVQITRTATAGADPKIKKFINYVPKKPSLPVGAVELGTYALMATFTANSTAGQITISQGTLRKAAYREVGLIGSWSTTFDAANINAQPVGVRHTSTSIGSIELTFWGTGFELRGSAASTLNTATTVTVDGLNLNTANYPSISSSTYGGYTFTHATANLNWNNGGSIIHGCGFIVTGLALGLHTVKINIPSANSTLFSNFDIITPIHSHKQDYKARKTSMRIGSESILDSRTFETAYKVTAQSAAATTTGPSFHGSGTAIGPVPGLACMINTTGKPVMIDYSIPVNGGAFSLNIEHNIAIDGVPIERDFIFNSVSPTNQTSLNGAVTIDLPAGQYHISVLWVQSTSSTVFYGKSSLNVRELN